MRRKHKISSLSSKPLLSALSYTSHDLLSVTHSHFFHSSKNTEYRLCLLSHLWHPLVMSPCIACQIVSTDCDHFWQEQHQHHSCQWIEKWPSDHGPLQLTAWDFHVNFEQHKIIELHLVVEGISHYVKHKLVLYSHIKTGRIPTLNSKVLKRA